MKIFNIKYLIFLIFLSVFILFSLFSVSAVKAQDYEAFQECNITADETRAECYGVCVAERTKCEDECIAAGSFCRSNCVAEERECKGVCATAYEEDLLYCQQFFPPASGAREESDYSFCNNSCSLKGLSAGTSAFESCLSECLSIQMPTVPATPQDLKSAGGRFGKLGSAAGLGGAKSFEETVGGVIKGALALVGMIFLMLMVYGGYIWMTARGEEEEAKRARNIITMAIIGISVVMAAYAITYFIVARLTTG